MPNLKQASRLAQLDSLGSSKDAFDIEASLPLLNQICGDFIKRVQANIESSGYDGGSLNASGKISQLELEETDNGINIKAFPHLVFQDLGVNGSEVKLYDTPFSYKDKMPPVAAIMEWVKLKGLQTRNNPKYKLKKVDLAESAAWGIAMKIKREGQKPKHIYSKEIPKLIDDLSKGFSDYAVTQIFKSM